MIGIQLTIKDTDGICLNELVGMVSSSKAAKELKALREIAATAQPVLPASSDEVSGSNHDGAIIKDMINGILHEAIGGKNLAYRTHDGCIRWGVAEREIGKAIDSVLG
ncbi:hypothetical protein KAR91_12200 [Candidatus Pacearchaeota archaeon]|nr:hypothetical protein [Candidatus Pacearchaeota archaeon]